MSATAAQIAELRRMVAEPLTTTYSDLLLQGFIERYPLMDELRQEPYTWTMVDGAYTTLANTLWIPTYDLNAAAADVWQEKLAALSNQTDFSADGGNFSLSQKFEHAEKMVKHYRSRRSAKNIEVIKWPREKGARETEGTNVNLFD